MKLGIIQHVPFEGPAAIAEWTRGRGHALSISRPFAGDPLPDAHELEWLVVLGGPMSVHDELEFSWLTQEKRLIESCLHADKKILGICLGAQMLADVLGARVFPAKHKEIGWFPVKAASAQHRLTNLFPPEFTAFHWHGETFDLPNNAVRLASTDPCVNQAFAYGSSAVGLQFHLEATPLSVVDLVHNCAHEVGEGPYEQRLPELAGTPQQFESLHQILYGLLDRMAQDDQN